MRLGVMILPDRTWRAGGERWRAAEELGFDSAWTYDHLWWRTLKDGPWYSAIPTLSAAAAVTRRIRIGVLVASPNFRHPVVLAKETMTIDDISGGRFILGLGAGSPQAGDADIIGCGGLRPAARADRFREFVELTDKLLTSPSTTFSGAFYTARDARMIPGCVQQPRVPLAIAAAGPAGLALAARHADAWVSTGPADFSRDYTPDECLRLVARQVRRLERECAAIGRDAAGIDRIFVCTGFAGDPMESTRSCLRIAQGYARAGITHLVIHAPRESGVYAGDPAMLRRIADEVMGPISSL